MLADESVSGASCLPLRVAGIVKQSIVDGPGLRLVVFAQGCPHGCHGCHNPGALPFDGGSLCTAREILEEMQKNPLLQGVTLSGGEPFCQAEAFLPLALGVKERGKNLWIYSGYSWEELHDLAKTDPHILPLLAAADVLVDGRYLHDQRDLTLPFRGSANQRVIGVAESLGQRQPVTRG